MKIAIIGSGISGLTAAHLLHPHHDITLYEAGGHIGGHTNTIQATWNAETHAVDTGFIVYNERTYPHFTRLLDELGVETQPSDMGFSVRCEVTGLEYSGSTLNTMFAQRRNLFRPSFHRMLRDIMRFCREAPEVLESNAESLTLGEYLERGHYSREFIDQHLVPMGSSVWSAPVDSMFNFPARTFVQFFQNHGFLDLKSRPQWRVIKGGSCRYVEKMIVPFHDRIRLNCPVSRVFRHPGQVEIQTQEFGSEWFDEVIFACHSDQARSLLGDATSLESEILGAIPYQANEAVLHTDASLMPRSKRAWAAWNYHRLRDDPERVTISYNMNILQSLPSKTQFLVTLNRSEAVDPSKIIRVINYHHPLFTEAAVRAQARHAEISGHRGTHYCGAYWRYGFHEDGVQSGIRVAQHILEQVPA